MTEGIRAKLGRSLPNVRHNELEGPVRLLLCGVCTLLVLASAAYATTIRPAAAEGPQSLEELLASGATDLVLRGTVLAATQSHRGYEGGCGSSNSDLAHQPVLEVDIRLDEVIFGIAPDSIVHVTILSRDLGPVVGKQVVVWAHRSCEDAWRIRGRMGVVEKDGTIGDGKGLPIYRNPDGHWESVYSTRVTRSVMRTRRHSTSLLDGVRGVALARLVRADDTDQTATYHIEVLGDALLGQTEIPPSALVFRKEARCAPGIFAGDSLLVPLRGVPPSPELNLDACPSALRVKNGFVPALGVPLEQLDRAFASAGHTWWLRQVLRPER